MVWANSSQLLTAKLGKGLATAAALVVVMVFVFYQSWIPVEISLPDTGLLVAMTESDGFQSGRDPQKIQSSAPKKAAAETPVFAKPPKFANASGEWKLGKPQIAYRLPTPFLVPSSERTTVWNFVIPTGVSRDLFLTGSEFRPGNTELIERMVLAIDPTGNARRQDQATATPGFPSDGLRASHRIPISEWSPKSGVWPMPTETGYRIPAGADLVLSISYKASPQPRNDPWTIGFHLQTKMPKRLLSRVQVRLGELESRIPLPADAIIHAVIPEIDYLESPLKIDAIPKSGKPIPLLNLNQEGTYKGHRMVYAQPLVTSKGTVIRTSPSRATGMCFVEISTPAKNP